MSQLMSLAGARKKRLIADGDLGKVEVGSASTKGNGHCETASAILPHVRMFPQKEGTISDPYKKPYGCMVCGLRLPEADAARLDKVIAEYGKVVRVMCFCHTGVMTDVEFGLLRHLVAAEAAC